MMDLFIYLGNDLAYGLDELEDALDVALGDVGKITGTGTGRNGSNIDVTFADAISEEQAVAMVREALKQYELSPKTKIVVVGGNPHELGSA